VGRARRWGGGVVLWGEASWLYSYEVYIYFERNMGAKKDFAWLQYFTYRLVPVGLLAPNYTQHIL
jgi:hypothetical protein